jgi:deoxyribodipyrimidine photolyase
VLQAPTRRGPHPTPLACPVPVPPAALCSALASLDRSLRQRGSRLLVRVGPWERELPALVELLGGGGVVAEAEVEAGEGARLCSATVDSRTQAAAARGGLACV